jgi:putative MATE family efflux protein
MSALTSLRLQRFKAWNLVKRSLGAEHQDYTSGDMRTAVFLLAIPMILELGLESVFAVVDMFFVAKLGPAAIATVGLTESVLTIVYSVAIGLSTAATAVVARRVGEKKPEEAAHAGAQAILISLAATLFISITGIWFAKDILLFMGAEATVAEDGAVFTRIMLGGSFVIMLLFLINGIFRGAGDAAMAMKSLWVACIINIMLDPIFIHFWGLKGAAMATVIGRGTGVMYQLYHLFRGDSIVRLKMKDFVPDLPITKLIASIGWPATFQFIIASGSWIVLARLVAETGGTEASAGYQIAIRNVVFFILPAWGLSNAAATLVGQNLGAGKPDRAEESVWLTAKYNAVFMSFVMVLFLFAGEPIIRIFSTEKTVVAFGAKALRIIGAGYIFYGIGMVMTQALNGAGDTKTPTWINALGFWGFQIPLAYALALFFDLKSLGVFIAIPVAETAIALAAVYMFKRGGWKNIKV